jgi:O-antigen/teichoic acid export membrane protein
VAGVARWLFKGRGSGAVIVQSTIVRAVMLGLNLVTGVITARALGPMDRGVLAALTLWPQLFGFLFTIGIPIAMVYHIKRDPERSRELFTTAFALAGIASVVAALAGYALVPRMLHAYTAADVAAARLMLVFTVPAALLLIVTCLHDARMEFGRSNRLRYLPPAATLGALLVLLAARALTPISAAVAYLAPQVFLLVECAVRERGTFARSFAALGAEAPRLVAYGLRFYALDVINTLAAQVDRMLVVAFLDPVNMGLYAVALNASRVLSIISWGTTQVVFPKAASLAHGDALQLAARGARLVGATSAVACAAFALALPVAIRILFGRAFVAAVPAVEILLVEATLSGVVATLAQGFIATGRPATMSVLQGAGLGTAVLAMLVLVPRLGICGAALSLLISTTLRLAALWFAYPVVLHAPLPRLVIGADDLRLVRAVLRREIVRAGA